MIVPMKKVSLVVLEREREDTLVKLREAGVVHLKNKSASSEIPVDLLGRQARNRMALGALYRYPVRDSGEAPYVPFIPAEDEIADYILTLVDEKQLLLEELQPLLREKQRVETWGNFEPGDFDFLEQHGIKLFPYALPAQALNRFGDDIRLIVFSRDRYWVKAVSIGQEIPGMAPFVLPSESLAQINSNIDSIRLRLDDIEARLAGLAWHKDLIESDNGRIQEEIEYDAARTGMETEEDESTRIAITGLSGFVPGDKIGILVRAATDNGWTLVWDDPDKTDRPPTILENKPAVRIIHPLFSMLGTLPGYWEYDISLSYMVFLCIFFAMILGDAVYGIIIFAAGFALGVFFKKKKGEFPDAAKLLMLLAFCTVIWGCISGSWFAVPASGLPRFLRMLIIPPFNNTGPLAEFPLFLQKIFNLPKTVPVDKMKTQWNIQFLCFTIGLFQLVWARGKNIRKCLPSLAALAQAGWLVILIGIYFVILFILLGVTLPSFVIGLIAGGFALILIFSEQWDRYFLKNIGKSFSNIIPIILKVIGCFGDIVSYIRLFAVGLAGSIIVQTINSMAIPQEGLGSFGLGFIFRLFGTMLILVFAHTLHLAINALSVIVHGLRLNLLEYAGNHLDIGWSGYEYNPFALKRKK